MKSKLRLAIEKIKPTSQTNMLKAICFKKKLQQSAFNTYQALHLS